MKFLKKSLQLYPTGEAQQWYVRTPLHHALARTHASACALMSSLFLSHSLAAIEAKLKHASTNSNNNSSTHSHSNNNNNSSSSSSYTRVHRETTTTTTSSRFVFWFQPFICILLSFFLCLLTLPASLFLIVFSSLRFVLIRLRCSDGTQRTFTKEQKEIVDRIRVCCILLTLTCLPPHFSKSSIFSLLFLFCFLVLFPRPRFPFFLCFSSLFFYSNIVASMCTESERLL